VTVHDIAKVCHEVNRAYCEALGDVTQPAWEQAPDWQRASAVAGVAAHLLDSSLTPRESHELWMAEKQRTGWRYGPVKDANANTHPCMVPFDDLPPEQRVKDYLFRAVVRALARHVR
jgi:hypothetical protein